MAHAIRLALENPVLRRTIPLDDSGHEPRNMKDDFEKSMELLIYSPPPNVRLRVRTGMGADDFVEVPVSFQNLSQRLVVKRNPMAACPIISNGNRARATTLALLEAAFGKSTKHQRYLDHARTASYAVLFDYDALASLTRAETMGASRAGLRYWQELWQEAKNAPEDKGGLPIGTAPLTRTPWHYRYLLLYLPTPAASNYSGLLDRLASYLARKAGLRTDLVYPNKDIADEIRDLATVALEGHARSYKKVKPLHKTQLRQYPSEKPEEDAMDLDEGHVFT